MGLQLAEQEGTARVAQPGQLAAAVDDGTGAGARGEVDPLLRRSFQVVGGLGQAGRRLQREAAEQLAGAVAGLERQRRLVAGLQRAHQQQALAQGGEAGLVVTLPRMSGQDLALGKLDPGQQRALQIVLRPGGVKDQWCGWLNGGQQRAACQGCADQAGKTCGACGHGGALLLLWGKRRGMSCMPLWMVNYLQLAAPMSCQTSCLPGSLPRVQYWAFHWRPLWLVTSPAL